jgi:hypothetical protein
LRVVFELRADRWQHAIERQLNGEWHRWLSSVEGDATDDWPPSPPFQELHRTTLADGRDVILLVGRAGTSHWSGSVEIAGDSLIFDIACRHSRAAERLGSAYAIIETRSVSEEALQVADATRVRRQDESLIVEPLTVGDSFPCTTRWKYVLSLLPSPRFGERGRG